jgi:two-component system, OmpR family, phosphate regulon response regulator OmpR
MIPDLPHLLVVDDDKRLRQLLGKYLAENGYRITLAADAADARTKLRSMAFDLIVCDIMMPGESGLDLTRDLRRADRVPILLLTAMNETEDRIRGLESGADDYLPKPFEPRELLLRIQSILRRVPPETPLETELRFGPLRFDPARRLLHRGPDEVRLTEAESVLLATLAEHAGAPVSREALSGGGDESGRAVDVQIARLRRKLEQDPRFPRYLQTVRGLGYMLQPD